MRVRNWIWLQQERARGHRVWHMPSHRSGVGIFAWQCRCWFCEDRNTSKCGWYHRHDGGRIVFCLGHGEPPDWGGPFADEVARERRASAAPVPALDAEHRAALDRVADMRGGRATSPWQAPPSEPNPEQQAALKRLADTRGGRVTSPWQAPPSEPNPEQQAALKRLAENQALDLDARVDAASWSDRVESVRRKARGG